jgi:hypothetical protein
MYITLPGYLAYFLPKIMTIFFGTYSSNLNKSAANSKNAYIATIQDKWPSPVIGHPMWSTYLENCSGVIDTSILHHYFIS